METSRGLFTKIGLLCALGITIGIVGKKHIAYQKNQRHIQESDSSIQIGRDEFGLTASRPGFPENNPTLDYDTEGRALRYVGKGLLYASRTQVGDHLGFLAFMKRRFSSDRE